MGQYLTNIGEVNTASVTVIASMGAIADVNIINSAGWQISVANTTTQVQLLQGTALMGTVNTVAIGGSDAVDILNSAGWVVSIDNTAGWLVSVENTASVIVVGTIVMGSSFIISNSSNLQTLVTNTVTAVDIINSAGWIVEVANTGGAYSLINTAGWVVSVANTGGIDVQLLAGSALIGTANVILYNEQSTSIVNSANWIVSGSMLIENSAGWFVNGGSSLIENSAGWAVNVINTAGLSVNVNSNTAGHVLIDTDRMSSGGIAVTPNFLPIDLATTEFIINASANKVLRVIGYNMMAAVANQVNFQTATGGADLTGNYYLAASGGLVCGYNPAGWFQTVAGDGLVLELAVDSNVGGCITYLVL